ncbi:multidrug resistance-associated protein 5, partial [Tanacetum coccineum]
TKASYLKIILTMDVHYNGHFTRNPVTYAKEFVKLSSKHDGRISLYVVHSLEGGIDNEEEDNCGIENDKDKELANSDADSDANSVASVDHLSEGEEELRQVRLKKAKSKIKSQEGGNYVEPDVESDRDMPKGDSDDEMNDTNKWIIHDPNTHWKLQKPILGERYDSFDQLKDCLIFYSVANGYQLWYEKSDSKKLLVKCSLDQKKNKGETVDPSKPKCPFNMRAVKMRDENTIHIRSLKDKHTCTRQYYLGSLITSKWIAQRFEDKLRMNPDMKVVDLQEYVLKKYRVKVSHHQCNRAKRMALHQLKQNVGTQYDRLVDYCYELKRSNPGTTVAMQVDPLVENTENWEWFLQHLRQDLDLTDGTGVALISDGHKGIIQAVKRVVPNVEHSSWKGCQQHKRVHNNGQHKKSMGSQQQNLMERNLSFGVVHLPRGRMHFEVRQEMDLDAFQYDFVTDSFRLATYKKLYEFNIKPVKGIDQWRKIKHIPCLPPKERRMPGRPSIARKKDKSELRKHVAKAPKFMTCKNCNQRGHNSSGCKNEKAPPVEKIPMKKGRPMVEDPVNARVPGKRKRKAGPINQDGAADVECEWLMEKECSLYGSCKDRADKDLVDIDVEFENVEVGRKFENIEVEFELIGVEVINEEQEDEVDLQEDGVDLQADGVDLQEDGVDLQDDGVDLQEDGVDLQHDGVELQEDEVDLQHDGAELQDDGHNIQPAVAPARVRTRRQSQRLVMRNWNRRPMPTVNGEGTTPEKAFLIL